mmetsp:Transcript_7/g.26  ORF Transcript_7/g.26 Transcript_7/m.26 type:complete len:243 (+) Transcript_7:1184-1912(+)
MPASSLGAFSVARARRSSATSIESTPPSSASRHVDTAFTHASSTAFRSSSGISHGNTAGFVATKGLSPLPKALTILAFVASASRAFLPFFSNGRSPPDVAAPPEFPCISFSFGISRSRSLSRAATSAFPPRMMSVPRPAMFVAMVTWPARPAWPTISLSRWTFSGLAFSSWYGTPTSSSRSPRNSLCSTLVVPMRTGRPFLCMRVTSVRTAFHFPFSVLKTTSGKSSRLLSRFVGTTRTGRP